MNAVYARLADMSNDALLSVWDSLGESNWENAEMHDSRAQITMNEWCEAVYSELSRRHLLS